MYPVNIEFWFLKMRGAEGHWALATLAIGFIYQRHRSLKAGYSHEWFVPAFFWSIFPGFIMARLFHFMFWETSHFFNNPLLFFTPGTGGNAILGATVGTGFGGWLYCKYSKTNFLHWCDSLMIPISLTLALARIACFLNGDAHGVPTGSFLGMVFSEDSDIYMSYWKDFHAAYATHANPLVVISQSFQTWGLNLADLPLPRALHHLRARGSTTWPIWPATIRHRRQAIT